MHLKVVLQGSWGRLTHVRDSEEFRELQRLIDAGEIAIAGELAQIGAKHWPEVEAILCNFWCRAPDIDGTTVKHYRRDRVLEASISIDGEAFLALTNETRNNALFFRALTLAAEGFRKYQRSGTEIEAVRDKHFRRPEGGAELK